MFGTLKSSEKKMFIDGGVKWRCTNVKETKLQLDVLEQT